MIPSSLQMERETSYRLRFAGAWIACVAVAILFASVAAYKLTGNVRTVSVTRTIPASVGTTAKLESALGSGQPVPCAQVLEPSLASQLQGAKCDVYQRQPAQDIVVVIHP